MRMNNETVLKFLFIGGLLSGGVSELCAANASVPGTETAPHPTQHGISIEWLFSGDDDGDGRVTVRYRSNGGSWKQGMPLFRVPSGSTSGFSWGNRHLGSLFDLTPATTYNIELTLTDPDGGGSVRTLNVATRALPMPMTGAPVKVATPATFSNVMSGAVPGDIIDLAAGTYGGFTWIKDGQLNKPIVVRSTAGAVIDGSIDLFSRSYVHFDGLIIAGRLRFNSCAGLAIQRCTINARADRGNGDGIVSYTRSENCYISDNIVHGTTVWAEASLGVSGANLGEGIVVNGPGHVVCYNRVHGLRDGISFMEDGDASDQYSIDIFNNDVSECADDGIEADFCAHNARIQRNRLTNCFIGLSSQPSLGGPTYFIRNVLYNIAYVPFKLYRTSYGDVVIHNTVIKNGDAFLMQTGDPTYRLWSRNNIFIGGPGSTWKGYNAGNGKVMDLNNLNTASADMDYDGYGSTMGTFTGRFGSAVNFTDLAQLQSQTTETHATQVNLSIFAQSITFPSAAMTIFSAPDLRLSSSSAAKDKGIAIAGINDGFTGSSPDLGAYELGQALPTYGPPSSGGGDTSPPATPPKPTVTGGDTATPILSGTTEAGATMRIYNGGVLIATTTANGSGQWSITVSMLGAGSHTLTVTASDASGNTSGVSPAVAVTVPTSGGSSNNATSAEESSGKSCGLGNGTAVILMLMLSLGLRLLFANYKKV